MGQKLNKYELHSGLLFLAGSVVAGLLNYLFQVIAARSLSAADYALLNSWFANLSLFFVLGAILQFTGNFWPLKGFCLRLSLIIVNIAALIGVAYWSLSSEGLSLERSATFLFLTVLLGWITGQTQIRLAYRLLAVAGMGAAATKVGILLIPLEVSQEYERYAFALFIATLPALWICSAFLLRAKDADPASVRPHFAAPIALAIATTAFPQFDIVLMSHTRPPKDFEEFVRAGVFFRALYFMIFIFAQWLLPRQIQGRSKIVALPLTKILTVAGLCSLFLGLISPTISIHILKWDAPPSFATVVLSSLQMSLIALLLIKIQEACATAKIRQAGVILGVLALEALIQMTLHLPVTTYLTMAITAQTILLIGIHRCIRRSN